VVTVSQLRLFNGMVKGVNEILKGVYWDPSPNLERPWTDVPGETMGLSAPTSS